MVLSAIDTGKRPDGSYHICPDPELHKKGDKVYQKHATNSSSKATPSESSGRHSHPRVKLTTKQENIKAYRPFTYKALGRRSSRRNYKSSNSRRNYKSSNSSKRTYKADSQPSFFEWFFHPRRAKAKARSTYRSEKSSHISSDASAKASTVSPFKCLSKKSSRRDSTTSFSSTRPQVLFSPPSKRKSEQKSEPKPKPKSEPKVEKKSGKSSDRTEKHEDHSEDEQPPYLWMLASGGFNKKPRNRRSKRPAPSTKSASGVETEKGTTSGQKSTPFSHVKKEKASNQVTTSSALPIEKKTHRKPIKGSSSKSKARPSHPFRRTKEEPWDVFDLLAPWTLTNKQKREYDQVVKACNDERVRQGKPKK